MARSALAVQEITPEGMLLAGGAMGAAWADGFYFVNDGDKRTWLELLNSSAAPITLTVQTTATRDGLPVADRTYTIAAGQRLTVGPFKPALYNRPDGTIYIDFSAVADVTISAYKLAG